MDKTTISQIWKSTVLCWETASHRMAPFFTVGLCPRWRWWLVEGGPYGFASTVYRLSNFHARSQFTPNNVSKHSGAIFHTRPDDCSYRFLVREAINWGQRRRFGLCSNCSTTEKNLIKHRPLGGIEQKMADNWTFGGRSNTFFGQVCGCQSPDNILIRISIKSTFSFKFSDPSNRENRRFTGKV